MVSTSEQACSSCTDNISRIKVQSDLGSELALLSCRHATQDFSKSILHPEDNLSSMRGL